MPGAFGRPFLSQRVYFGLVHGEPLPAVYHTWQMAERFSWTLEYVESLPVARWHEFLQIEDGKGKSRTSLFVKKGQKR